MSQNVYDVRWNENYWVQQMYTNNSYENNHCLFVWCFAVCWVRHQNYL